MKKKMYGVMAFVLLFVTLGLLAGCGAKGGGTDVVTSETVDRSNFNTLGTYPLVKTKENITILTPTTGLEVDLDQFWQTSWYEEKTNVHVNWQYAPSEQFKERVNLALASAEKLDLVLGFPWGDTGFTQSEFLRLATQRLILPIGDYFDTDTINIKENLDSIEGYRDILTMPDGKIYNLPELEECLHCMYYGKMWINKEFLKNVGITKYPETPAEFKAMLIAFRDNDANGNGDPNDEIPIMGTATPGSYSSRLDTYLMNAFGVYSDGLNRLYLDNKVVKVAYQQEGFREGLKYLNDLFKEGLISRDSFSATVAIRQQINSQKDESLIGAIPYEHHHGLGTRETGKPVRWIDYEAIPPLKGPNGKQVARFDPYLKFRVLQIGSMVPSTARNPALIARWMDYYHTFEGAVIANMGGKGIGWDDPDPDGISISGEKPAFKMYILEPDDEWYQKNMWGGQLPNFRRSIFWAGQQADTDPLAQDGMGAEAYLYQISEKNYQPYGDPSFTIPPLWYSPEDTSEMTLLTTNINTLVEENIAKFIVGDLDPNNDADWTSFQSQLNSLNVARYLEIVQKAYDASSFSK